MESRAPRVGHKKSRNGCAQCKRRHVKCNEEAPCANCVRHGVACSLAGGPNVPRDDAKKPRRKSNDSSSTSVSRTTSLEAPLTSTIGPSSSTENSPACLPFTILTESIERPSLSGQEPYWNSDLQLMHHYMNAHKLIVTEHHEMDYIHHIWRDEVPKLAFSCDYLMHGLLGFTALHKAHLEPENAVLLRANAVDHLDKALTLYRQFGADTPTEENNANQKFLFTWLVALFSYAISQANMNISSPIDAMVELTMLAKGIDAALTETWYWVAQGSVAPILTRGFQEAIMMSTDGTVYALPEGIDFGLGHLDYMLGVDAMLPDDRRVCALVIGELKQIYSTIIPTQGSCSVYTLFCFPKHDPAAFAELVRKRQPQALIILAHYCVLLDILDSRWWMRGWSSRLLTDIAGCLDEASGWRQWIQWPIEQILMR